MRSPVGVHGSSGIVVRIHVVRIPVHRVKEHVSGGWVRGRGGSSSSHVVSQHIGGRGTGVRAQPVRGPLVDGLFHGVHPTPVSSAVSRDAVVTRTGPLLG